MAKKVVGGVMIIHKNAETRAHPRPPLCVSRKIFRGKNGLQ